MFDPLLEFQIILGVFFWLVVHQLMVLKRQIRHRQRWVLYQYRADKSKGTN